VDVGLCRAKYKALAPTLTERARRIWAATEARAAGWGGITGVARATGISYSTIQRGLQELTANEPLAPDRIRRPGGGRKKTLDKDPTLLADLEGLVEPTASGDPMSPLRWTSKSVRHLAASLQRMGHQVSRQLVAELLAAAGYSLQANRKTREGTAHPDRDAQFRYINQQVRRFQAATQPVISVDTKKKELVGDFKNAGRQWRPKGQPAPVRVHDFLIPARGKAIPYGVYDLTRNAGWVSVGVDGDVRGAHDRTLVGQDGPAPLSSGARVADHGGCRRQQRGAGAALEMGIATVGHPHALGDHRLSPAARDQQVEQDRAPALFVHQHELAWPAPGESRGDRQSDWRHPHRGGAPRPV